MFRILLLLFFSTAVYAQDKCGIAIQNASEHKGEDITVCGVVTQVSTPYNVAGDPTYLNFGGRYPNHSFTAVIWGRDTNKFIKNTDTFIYGLKGYEGKKIAVTGVIQDYRGKPQIVLVNPEQIEVIE